MSIKRVIAASVLGLGVAIGGIAIASEDEAFQASATILDAIAVTKVADLVFANIAPGATTGTVVVSAAGVRTCNAPLTCSGSVSAADFGVTGASDATFAVTLPPAANISSGTDTMLVDGFTSSLGSGTGTLVAGAADFQLGATLNVGANQAAGAYSGTFNVTVEYN